MYMVKIDASTKNIDLNFINVKCEEICNVEFKKCYIISVLNFQKIDQWL
jgi:hypothetical protein